MVMEVVLKNLFKKPMTIKFPYESIETAPRYRGKHEFYIDRCISCAICQRVCPNQAIRMVPSKNKEKYPKLYPEIDLGKCCWCGLCEEFCPKDAIKLTQDYFLSTFDPNTVILPPDREKDKSLK